MWWMHAAGRTATSCSRACATPPATDPKPPSNASRRPCQTQHSTSLATVTSDRIPTAVRSCLEAGSLMRIASLFAVCPREQHHHLVRVCERVPLLLSAAMLLLVSEAPADAPTSRIVLLREKYALRRRQCGHAHDAALSAATAAATIGI